MIPISRDFGVLHSHSSDSSWFYTFYKTADMANIIFICIVKKQLGCKHYSVLMLKANSWQSTVRMSVFLGIRLTLDDSLIRWGRHTRLDLPLSIMSPQVSVIYGIWRNRDTLRSYIQLSLFFCAVSKQEVFILLSTKHTHSYTEWCMKSWVWFKAPLLRKDHRLHSVVCYRRPQRYDIKQLPASRTEP